MANCSPGVPQTANSSVTNSALMIPKKCAFGNTAVRIARPTSAIFSSSASADLQHPVDARPADAERLGNIRGADALRLHLAHPTHVYRGGPALSRREPAGLPPRTTCHLSCAAHVGFIF